jgi:hypothetical protein
MESACGLAGVLQDWSGCRAMSGVGSALQTPTMTKNVLLGGPMGACPGEWMWLSQAKRNTANAVLESDQPAVGTSNLQSDVPDGDTQRLRHELEGVGVGSDGHVQQTERFNLFAADPSADLVGFSDGSLSGDGNSGGCSWMTTLVKDGTIQKGDMPAGGGGAALLPPATPTCCSAPLAWRHCRDWMLACR